MKLGLSRSTNIFRSGCGADSDLMIEETFGIDIVVEGMRSEVESRWGC